MKLAYEYRDICLLASETIQKDFYVNDLITGYENVNNAINVTHDTISILSKGWLELRKWSYNSS